MADTEALDWITPLAARGPVPGLARPLRLSYVVPKTADGDLSFSATFEPADGDGGGDGDEADEVELTAVPKVADLLASGASRPNVAWMSGKLKVASGPTGPLLAVLALADSVAAAG